MKSIILLTSCLLILLSSCMEKSEQSYKEVETTLKIDIPFSAVNSGDAKSEAILEYREIPFSGTNDLGLSEIINPASGVSTIQSVKPLHGAVLSVSQIGDGDEISSLQFNWGYKTMNDEDYIMMESIDLLVMEHQISDGIFQVNFDEIASLLVDEINNADMLRFNISGNCNNSINGLADLEIPVVIETEVFMPRFELF